jgi:hypothetical protein
MDTYVDNRSFEELVTDTTPDDSYDFVIDNILRDRDNGWTLNYYKPSRNSSCDAEIARINQEIIECTTAIAVNQKLVTKIEENIKNASQKNKKIAVDRAMRSAIKDEMGVETKWGQEAAEADTSHLVFKSDLVEKWKNQRNTAEEEIRIDTRRLKEIKSLLPKWEWNRYLELSLESNIQRLRNQFVIDHDEEFLRKGVTWACKYADTNRYTLVDVVPKE